MKRHFGLLIAVLLLLALAFRLAAQEEVETARVRIGYFAFDPTDYDTYVDGVVFPFTDQLATSGWSMPCYGLRCFTASPFFDFTAGVHSLAIAAKDEALESAIVGPQDVTFEAGHAYSLAVVGSMDAEDLNLLVIDDMQILAGNDLENTAEVILVNNLAGLPAIEQVMQTEPDIIDHVEYGGFAGKVDAGGQPITFTLYATAESRPQLFELGPTPLPVRVSALGALYGSYPGTFDRDYFYTANWGYPGPITILDGGVAEVGIAVAGEIAAVTQRVAYTLTLEEDAVLNISVRQTGAANRDTPLFGIDKFDPAVYLFNDQGRLLDWIDDPSMTSFEPALQDVTLQAGIYRIEVGGSLDLVSGPYELVVERAE